MSSELICEFEDSIAILTLNRPEKRNTLNDALINSLRHSLLEIEQKEKIYAVVIRGAGKDFCSGADLSTLQKIAQADIMENLFDAENLMNLFLTIRKLSLPVIAAVTGKALAGGCGLATACDVVLASKSSRFGYPEVKIGFVPAMVMAILRRNVSEKKAFELITQGFDFSAEEAEKIGLVNKVFEDEGFYEKVISYASIYKGLSRSAVILSKRLLYQMDSINFEACLQIGAEVNTIARFTKDCRYGISKFLNK
jgi:methylglutaconyl-CoA hydratase